MGKALDTGGLGCFEGQATLLGKARIETRFWEDVARQVRGRQLRNEANTE
jgi:hypothetical protein